MPKTTLAIVVLSTLLAFAGATAGYLWFQGQVLARSSSAAFGQAIVQTQDGLDEAGGVIQNGWQVNQDARWLGIAARDLLAASQSVAVMKHLDRAHTQDWVRLGSALHEASYRMEQIVASIQQAGAPTAEQREVIQHVQTLIMAAATALPKGVRDGGDPHALLDVRRIQEAADAGDRFQSALPARPR